MAPAPFLQLGGAMLNLRADLRDPGLGGAPAASFSHDLTGRAEPGRCWPPNPGGAGPLSGQRPASAPFSQGRKGPRALHPLPLRTPARQQLAGAGVGRPRHPHPLMRLPAPTGPPQPSAVRIIDTGRWVSRQVRGTHAWQTCGPTTQRVALNGAGPAPAPPPRWAPAGSSPPNSRGNRRGR